MPDSEDISLLKRYANGDEPAFTLLVERYIHLVYSTALRQVGNPSHAEEISQAVFIILTRKANSISPKTILSGWLYQTARLTAANFLRSESRRQQREQEAYMQSTLSETDTRSWNEIAPLLEEAMGRLGQADRDAIVLRFFENKTPQELATMLGLNEVTARKRVSRALERLRNYFSKRGVNSSTSVIAETISGNAVQVAPAGLAKSVAAIALAKGVVISASTLTLTKGAVKFMAWTKMKTTVVASVAILLAAGTTVVVSKSKARADLKKDFVAYAILKSSAQPADDSETRRQLEGTWIITDKRFVGKPRYAHYRKNNPHLKTWTLTNWAIVTYDAKSNVVYSASGPYDLNGTLYTETVESGTGTMTNYIGTSLQYKLRVEGDKYYQMGAGIEETGQRIQE